MQQGDSPSSIFRILLVDDSPDDRMLAAREIRKVMPEAVIDQAGSREQFEQLLRSPQWDVAVLDFQLLWSTGLDVFRRLRAMLPDMPVIMFTASGSEEVAVEALKEGLDDYITKSSKHYGRIPYSIVACVERRRQRRQIVAAREELARSEALYRTLAEASPDFVLIIDGQTRVDYVNRRWEEYTGLTLQALNEQGFMGRVHPDDVARVEQLWSEAVRTRSLAEGEFRYRGAQGAYRWFLGRTLPLRPDADTRWVAICTDIHERKLMEQDLLATTTALKEADRQRNQFLATLAHELRNPMAPIRYATAMIRADAPPQVLEKVRSTIDRQSTQMARLLDDLLDLSRITRDIIELQRAPLDLVQLVEDAVENVRPEASAQRHEISVEFRERPLWVDGDVARLQQVAGNLLSNAIKYTPPGGRIGVVVEASGGHVRLHVTDSGVGLSPDMLPRLFQLFSQLHRGLSVSTSGLGIGLAVSRRLVELHGGTLEARSEGLGRGAEFVVTLPRVAAPLKSGSATASDPGDPAARHSFRVLVVDDNEDAATTLGELLSRLGHEVHVATTGRQAIEKALAHAPDVVVLDIGLPDISGVEVARQLRSDAATRSALLVAVTGWGQEEDRRRTEAVGVDYHLVKPVDPEVLLRIFAERSPREGGQG